MKNRHKSTTLIAISLGVALAGCATHVPEMQKFGETPDVEAVREGNLVSHIKCELHKAVQDLVNQKEPDGAPQQEKVQWLRDWGAQASLKLVIDEKAGLTPGVTFNIPKANVVRNFPSGGPVVISQSQNTALSASITSDATRTDTIGLFYKFSDLLDQKDITMPCSKASGMLIDGDLKIEEFMTSKILIARVPGVFTPPKTPALGDPSAPKNGTSPFSTFTYEVTFVVSSGGGVAPIWKLVSVSANPLGTFVNASRTRTSDLILTLGPIIDGKASQDAQNAHLADLIGRAVAQNIASHQ